MRVVRVSLGRRSYSVRITRGPVERVALELSRLLPGRRVALMTDRNVGPLYAGPVQQALLRLGLPSECHVLGAGERAKTARSVVRAWQWLLEKGFDRATTAVLALGGGVVGDLAGFVASTYVRGVPVVQVPTTLLSQVDASVGGKTGIDLPGAKNAAGTFHQPRLVHASLDTLKTLTPRDYRCGLAEVVKYGVIARPELLRRLTACSGEILARDPAALEPLVAACCEIKRDLVQADELEDGARRLLNFGHTFGHAIEVASRHRTRHGEAVALGMMSACRVSEALGLCGPEVRDEIEAVLRGFGLGTRDLPWLGRELVEVIRRDKKLCGDRIGFVTIRRIGDVAVTPVSLAQLESMVLSWSER